MDEVRQATSKEKKADETRQLDRRARKTRRAIQNALMQLSVDKRINEITVTDVTQAADINRSTFYLHYNSVYEVLADIEQSSTDTMLEIVNKYDPVQLPLNPYPLLKALTEEADANPAFMRFVSDSKISTTFLPKLKKTFAQLTPEEKNAISHRGLALRAFREKLEEYLHSGKGES